MSELNIQDSFHEMLPSLLCGAEDKPHSTAQLGKKNAKTYREGLQVTDTLAEQRRVAAGATIAMLISSDRDNKRNSHELDENKHAASRMAKYLKNLGIGNETLQVDDYSRKDVESLLADPEIAHMMFFGHAKRSGVFVPGDPITWRNTEPAGHLKKSVGIIGCGVYDRRGVTPRFGYNLVDPVGGILYGTADGTEELGSIRPSQMANLSVFSELAPRLIDSEHISFLD